MDFVELLFSLKGYFIYVVKYFLPIAALILSILSFRDSKKANNIKERLNNLEEILKKYQLEDKEKEREDATKSCVEVRIVKVSRGNYKMKVRNSGKATAYNVDFEIPTEYENMVYKDKVPYEFLESGKSFEEHVLAHHGTPSKLKVTTRWTDEQGTSYSKEQIVSL